MIAAEGVAKFLSCISLSLWLRHQHSNRLISRKGARGEYREKGPSRDDAPVEIQAEMYSRICSFFGEESFHRIRDAFVIVVGLGGVGSHAVNMLVRSGVQKVRIIDFDQVTLSSLNRHSLASLCDVGRSKALVLKERLQAIAPWVEVDAVTEMFVASEADRLLAGKPTYVLDCIDDVNTKAELIAFCVKAGLQVLTSMGAGGKSDPTRLRVAQLTDCINDPLCSKIKWKLKKHGVAADAVTGVFSNEKPCVNLLPLSDEQAASPQDFGAVDYLRLRVMPVLGTSPAIFGQAMASKVLCTLGGNEYLPESCERMSKNLKHKLVQQCRSVERRRFHTAERDVALDDEDLEFVVGQVWGSRCAISGKRFGGHQPLVMVRWRRSKSPSVDNLVLMTADKAKLIEDEDSVAAEQGVDTPGCFEAEVTARIEARLMWARTVVQGAEAPSVDVRGPWSGYDPRARGMNLWIVASAAAGGYAVGYLAAATRAFKLGLQI
eukprot:GSChrysophyteH1.ASY1.ANO1.1609.1 assembled CDS